MNQSRAGSGVQVALHHSTVAHSGGTEQGPQRTPLPRHTAPWPNREAPDLLEALGQQGLSVSPPHRLQLGLLVPWRLAKRPQASAQRLPGAQCLCCSRCSPFLYQVPPGSETSGQPQPAGARPDLIRGWTWPLGPRKQLGAGHHPRHLSSPWASCCRRKTSYRLEELPSVGGQPGKSQTRVLLERQNAPLMAKSARQP